MDGSIRSVETLVRSYPQKSGTEILEMYEQDKKDAKKWQEEQYKEMYAEAEQLRKDKYIAIHYPTMVYYLRIDKVDYQSGENIYIEGLKTIIHDVNNLTKGGLHIETFQPFSFDKWDTYYSKEMKVLTEKEWDEVHEKINNIYKEGVNLFGSKE